MHRLTIKIEGMERRRRTTGILHLAAAFFLLFNGSYYWNAVQYTTAYVPVLIYAIALLSLAYGFFRKKLDSAARYNSLLRILQFGAALVLFLVMINNGKAIQALSLFVFAVVLLVLLFSERKIFKGTDMILNNKGIFIPGYFKDHYLPWHNIDNVVVREDYITVFRTNQRYLQYELLTDDDGENRLMISAYCLDQIKQHQISTSVNNEK
jgi:uncharacterized membrane protein YobD (UPF0266 family)